jgi:hypothetical protein
LSPPEKGRDAVCPSQAHPSARALAAAGPMRRQRRIPPRGDRAELATAREIETSECANGNNGGIAWAKARNALQDSRLTRSIKNATDGTVSLNRRVFQRYRWKAVIRSLMSFSFRVVSDKSMIVSGVGSVSGSAGAKRFRIVNQKTRESTPKRARDLQLNFHPATVRASAVDAPCGAV